MKYVALPFTETRRLSFYLAMEEFLAKPSGQAEAVGRPIDESDCFFMWQVEPTVIFGRNQVVENEVNLDYCREHSIHVVRRKSGGGCVYADMDNVMLSFVTSEENVGIAFNRFVNMVLLVFRKMAIEATGSSHNDIMIGDRKVCGTACYHVGGRSIVHSTLLYDTNMEHMLHAITPGPEKLKKRGIQSVRQRITFLKDHTSLGLDEVKTLIRDTLCVGERMLTTEEVAAIEQIEEQYLREDFIKHIQ